MASADRMSSTARRLWAALGAVLVVAALVVGAMGVITYTGGSDLGLLALVAGLALLTAGMGLIAMASRGSGSGPAPRS